MVPAGTQVKIEARSSSDIRLVDVQSGAVYVITWVGKHPQGCLGASSWTGSHAQGPVRADQRLYGRRDRRNSRPAKLARNVEERRPGRARLSPTTRDQLDRRQHLEFTWRDRFRNYRSRFHTPWAKSSASALPRCT